MENIISNTASDLGEDLHLADYLIKQASNYFNEEEVSLIKKSFLVANDLHRGQKRESGEPYIIHPVAVAYILLEDVKLTDVNSICAALLHDTIEDTGISLQFLEKEFNSDIAHLVASVSKIKNLNFTSKSEEEQYNTCLLLRNLMADYRVILLKLADRVHNMRTICYKKKYKQHEKAKETLTLFVPLALGVGATNIKRELEELSFPCFSKRKYLEIKGNVDDYTLKHQKEIEDILLLIEKTLLAKNISCDIRVKTKGTYELANILKPQVKLSSISDLISFEIVVDTKEECYLALCYLESILHPVDVTQKNYIANPKPNGYRALETIVTGFKGHPIELKICSKEMNIVNQYGLAVLNKLNPSKSIFEIQKELMKSNRFLQTLKVIDDLYKVDNQFIEQVSQEILSKQILVFSKDGDMYSLRKGATALDFAYLIHSKVGDHAVGAIVNGREVSVSYVLKNNDSIEIITNKLNHQDEESLKFVTTALAKKKINEGIRKNRALVLQKKKPL